MELALVYEQLLVRKTLIIHLSEERRHVSEKKMTAPSAVASPRRQTFEGGGL